MARWPSAVRPGSSSWMGTFPFLPVVDNGAIAGQPGEIALQEKIVGTVMPVLELTLDPGESIFAESGELSWMSESIAMATTTQTGGGGGALGALCCVAGCSSL